MRKSAFLDSLNLPPDAEIPSELTPEQLVKLQSEGDQAKAMRWRDAVKRSMDMGKLAFRIETTTKEVRTTILARQADGRAIRTARGWPLRWAGPPKEVETKVCWLARSAVDEWLRLIESDPTDLTAYWLKVQKEASHEREDRRLSEYLAYCEMNGLTPPKNSLSRRNGIVGCADKMGITHQSLSADIKSALDRRDALEQKRTAEQITSPCRA